MNKTAQAQAGLQADLVSTYRAAYGSGYDELLDGSGQVRPHWRALLDGLGEMSEADRANRAQRLDRRVRDTGIAYDIFSDPRKPSQRWQLDLAPLMISAAEWRWL
ncbi:MAG: hypothetical protein ACXW3Y_14650, partial [Rhodoplanes sp.]